MRWRGVISGTMIDSPLPSFRERMERASFLPNPRIPRFDFFERDTSRTC
jgi:hypothetical protein